MTVEKKQASLLVAKQLYSEYKYVLYFQFTGVNVAEITNFRRSLQGSRVIVLKNTINRIATVDSNFKILTNLIKGQVSTIFTNDPVEVAKILSAFLQKNKSASFVGFGDESNVYDYNYLKYISTLPSLLEIRGKLAGIMVAPHSKLIRICKEVATQITRVIDAKSQIG